MESVDVLKQNLEVARGFKPYSAEEMQALREHCRKYAGDGHFELYKTTKFYDGDEGRKQHHFPPPEQLPF
jgi:hypothetical protein